jgi:hypothetical protein
MGGVQQKIRLDELAQSLSVVDFSQIELALEKPRMVWVVTVLVGISRLVSELTVAIIK